MNGSTRMRILRYAIKEDLVRKPWWLATVLLTAAVTFGTFYTPSKAAASNHCLTDLPDCVNEAPKRSWYDYKEWGWVKGVDERLSRDDNAKKEIAALKAENLTYLGKQRHHDAVVDDLKAQNGRTEEHFESIIAERNREVKALRLHNKSLDQSIQDFQDKDNSMMFVEGCWVPIDSGQDSTL